MPRPCTGAGTDSTARTERAALFPTGRSGLAAWRDDAHGPMQVVSGRPDRQTAHYQAAIAKCSADTALRDISDLVARGVLMKAKAGGRSTHYELAP